MIGGCCLASVSDTRQKKNIVHHIGMSEYLVDGFKNLVPFSQETPVHTVKLMETGDTNSATIFIAGCTGNNVVKLGTICLANGPSESVGNGLYITNSTGDDIWLLCLRFDRANGDFAFLTDNGLANGDSYYYSAILNNSDWFLIFTGLAR